MDLFSCELQKIHFLKKILDLQRAFLLHCGVCVVAFSVRLVSIFLNVFIFANYCVFAG
jgi:hypothetical protein